MTEGEVVQALCEATLVVATAQENEEEICLC
jgi:hypothetical protein